MLLWLLWSSAGAGAAPPASSAGVITASLTWSVRTSAVVSHVRRADATLTTRHTIDADLTATARYLATLTHITDD